MNLEESILSVHTVQNKTEANNFIDSGLPGKKNEEYKFTDLKKVIEKNFSFQKFVPGDQNLFEILKDKLPSIDNASKIVITNGVIDEALSKIPSNLNWTKEKKADSELVKALKAKSSHSFEVDATKSLNNALSTVHNAFYVEKNQIIDEPVYIINLIDASHSEAYVYPSVSIEHGENSQADYVVINLTHGNNSSLVNSQISVFLEQNAVVSLSSYQNDTDASVHINNVSVFQDKQSNFTANTITLGGGLVRNNLNIALVNEHIESNMFGLYLVGGKSHVDNHTSVDHQYPNCVSNELYKGVLADQSRGVFNGKIFVREDAQQTNAFQSNNNILISDKATVNTKPQLEIWADDVKCSHGCTVGQLDEEAIFYMQARGVDKESAQALLLQAYAADVIDKIKVKELKAFLINEVNARIK